MKIKVCGMRDPENISEILKCGPDLIGHIFYSKSPRFVDIPVSSTSEYSKVKKVGVFVNSPINEVLDTVDNYKLDYIQLHGNENLNYVKELSLKNQKIIKAFQISSDFDWQKISPFGNFVSYFLFDTASSQYGGSGKKFNWNLIEKYHEEVPFFLSGGISLEDVQSISNIQHPMFYGIDINSKFEFSPGMKDINLVRTMIKSVRNG